MFKANLMVCPECGYHLRISPQERIKYIADEGSFVELFSGIKSNNPIDMEGYEEKLEAAKAKTSLDEAVVTGSCTVENRAVLLGIMSQEGLFSLMQMAKTSSAAARLDEEGVPYFVMLCDPTTGGVTASFAMLGDIICAEPGALIGFAGPRVIEGTIKQKLPEGFQRAEFQQQKGFVDCIVPRAEQKAFWAKMIDAHKIVGK